MSKLSQIQALSREEKRAAALERKRAACADCGRRYIPEFMTFDHVRGVKVDAIGTMVQGREYDIHHLLAELAKCEVVCAWCHESREIRRGVQPVGWRGLSIPAAQRFANAAKRRAS